MDMKDSSLLRGPVLLVSAKLEPSSTMAFSKDHCSILAPAGQTNCASTGKTPQIQLLTIAKTAPSITLIQTASNRGGKTYTEFAVDKNRAVYPGLHLGATFSSYQELTELMHKFQKAKGVHLYIRSSRKLYPAVNNMGGTLREYNLDLMFADIYYSCTKGGRRFCRTSSSSSSCSPSTSKFNQEVRNCPFNIKLRLTRDGQKLYIRDIYPAHNHYLDRNSQPRIPHPSIVDKKLRDSEQPPVAVGRTAEIRAVIDKGFRNDGKRLVVLTSAARKLLPVALTAASDASDTSDNHHVAALQPAGSLCSDAEADRSNADTNASETSNVDMLLEADTKFDRSFDIEPECILGAEEKIVPDIDDDDDDDNDDDDDDHHHHHLHRGPQESNEIKPWIKEEVLDECSASDADHPTVRCDVDLPCSDQAFVVSRRQILEMVKFCTMCGSEITQRYYSDKTDSLGIAIKCTRDHIVEWNLLKRVNVDVR